MEVFSSRSFGDFVIDRYVNCHEVYIKFLNTGSIGKASAGNIRNGFVKDVMAPSVAGIGYLGGDKFKCRYPGRGGSQTKEYATWSSMIRRCYAPENDIIGRAYADCSVCPEWHNFQVFAEWCQTQPEMLHSNSSLDKDIRVRGNRVYSPAGCSFVPLDINIAVTGKKHFNTTGLTGIHATPEGFAAEVTLCGTGMRIGTFATKELAHFMYCSIKNAYIRGLAEVHKDKLSLEVYLKLSTWESE